MKTNLANRTLVQPSPAFRVLLGLMSAFGVAASAHAVEKTWDGGAGTTNWHDAANWSPDGIPGPTDDAIIGAGFPEVLYSAASGDRTVATLSSSTVLRITGGVLRVSSGGTISGRLTMTGGSFCPGFSSGTPLDLTGTNNSIANATLLCGTLRVGSGATLSLANSTIGGALTNDGAVTVSGNQTVTIGVGGSVLNRGEWSMSAAGGQNCILSGNCNSFTATFTNEGTLRTTGAGIKSWNSSCSPLILTSTGLVLVEAGELRTNCSATLSTGAAVSAGATLTNQNSLTLNGAVTGAGTFTHTGGTTTMNAAIAGTVAVPTFSSGTVNINTAFVRPTALAMSSVTVGGTGTLTLQATGNTATGSTIGAATTVASGATLSLTNSTIAGALVNDGTVTMSGNQTVTLGVGGSVLNRGEWSMSAASGQNCILSGNCNSFTATFTNEGTLRATGAGIKSWNSSCSPLILTSTGLVLVEAGELRTNCNATLSTGAVVSAGATVTNQSALTLGAPVTGGGQFQSTGGTLTLAAAIAQPIGIALTSTTVQGTGSLTLQGAVNSMNGVALNAPVTVASGKALSLTNTTISRALTNDGTVTMSGNQTVTLGVGGSVLNRGEWSMSAAGGQNCILSGNCNSFTATFTNEGTLRTTGAGIKSLNSSCSPLVLTSTGSVLVEAGQLRLNCSVSNLASNRLAGGVWDTSGDLRLPQAIRTIAADVTLRGSGEIRSIDGNTLQLVTLSRIELGARGRFIDTGVFPISPFGGTLLNEGNLTLEGTGALNINGAFAAAPSSSIIRAATGTDNAISANSGAIDGAFTLLFAPSFTPAAGTTWTLATFPQGRSGAFASTALPPFAGLTLGATSITVTLESIRDLVSEGPVVAATVSAGAPLSAAFTERNAGNATAAAPWTSRVDLVVSQADPTVVGTLGNSVAAADLTANATAARSVDGTAPFFSGTLVPRLALDVDDNVNEASLSVNGEANNTSFGAPIQILAANLVAGSVSAPSTVTLTEPATISFATANTGAGDSIGPAFTDRVFLSVDAKLDASDTLLGSVARGGETLAAGASLAGGVTFTLPESTPTGTYSILIAVDATGARFESNDGDNALVAGTVLVQSAGGPDLVVTAVEIPSSIEVGQPFTLRWTVRNEGSASAEAPWSDQAFRSDDAVFGKDEFLTAPIAATAALAAGAERTVEVTLTAPDEETDFFVFVRTDIAGQVDEGASAEGNNTSAAIGPISVRFPPNPDLTIASIAVPSETTSGGNLSVTVVERNEGTADATAPRLIALALSTNNIAGDADDVPLGEITAAAPLEVDADLASTAEFFVPPTVIGPRFVVAVVDPLDVIDERPNESNNTTVSAAVNFIPDTQAPTVLQWASIKGEGDSTVALVLAAGAPVSEPRSGGLTELVTSFNEPIDAASLTASSIVVAAFDDTGAEVKLPAVTISVALAKSGTSAEIGFAPRLRAGLRYCVRIVGATDLSGNTIDAASARIDVTVATGEVTGDQRVNVTDFGAIATLLGVTVDESNATHVRSDLDFDGTITPADLALALSGNGVDLRAALNPCGASQLDSVVTTGPSTSVDQHGTSADTEPSLAEMLHDGISAAAAVPSNSAPAGDGAASAASAGATSVDSCSIEVESLASLPRGLVLPGVVALRATPKQVLPEVAMSPAEAVDALASVFTPVGEIDGWFVAVARPELDNPAAFAAACAMFVASGLDVGVIVHVGDGWLEIVGPDLVVRFDASTDESAQKELIGSLHGGNGSCNGGFVVTRLSGDEWLLESQSRLGSDAWMARCVLESLGHDGSGAAAASAGSGGAAAEEAP